MTSIKHTDRIVKCVALCAAIAAGVLSPVVRADAPANPLIGGWKADTYYLKDGSMYPLLGQIIFAAKNWSVLFIVVQDGKPQRGNGEGGEYVVDGNNITFTHHFMISTSAPAIPGLKEQAMRSLEWDKAEVEHSTFEVKADRMTLFMPSGNRLTWSRSSM